MKKEMSEDKFLLLSEDKAVEHHFYGDNFKLYKWLISIVFFSSLFAIPFNVSNLFNTETLGIWIGAPIFGTLWFLRKKNFTENNFYLLLRILLVLIYIFFISEDIKIWEQLTVLRITLAFVYPILLIFFRLRSSDLINTFLILLSINLFDFLVPYHSKSILRVSLLIITYIIFLGIALGLSIKKKKKFLKSWRKEVKKNKERLRMKLELERAKEIQLDMLPKSLPASEKLDIAWQSLPATEVGGDYYDSFILNEQKVALVVGDVSGHGLASSLVLSGTRAGLHLLHDNITTPEEILTRLNKMMKKTTDKKTFMTMIYAVFNLSNKIMTLANAGHTPVLHYSAKNKEISYIRLPSLPLGSRINSQYKEIEISFKTNDIFLFYSDGLSEAMNSDNELYEEKRFVEYFRSLALQENHVQEIMESILTDVNIFCTGVEQKDDITLVVVKIK